MKPDHLTDDRARRLDLVERWKAKLDLHDELVAALRECADFYGAFVATGGHGETFASWTQRAHALTSRARAVLAKAEGAK